MGRSIASFVRVCAGLVVLLCGCAGNAPRGTDQYLEEASGTTITRLATPLVLHAEEPALAANARDYVYVAPLAVSRGGRVSYWMWLGAWSTIDRGTLGGRVDPDEATVMQLLLDGEPMDLEVEARSAVIEGVKSAPYSLPVGPARGTYVPLSASQVARLAAARGVALYVTTASGSTRLWQPWGEADDGLQEFARVTGVTSAAGSVTAIMHER